MSAFILLEKLLSNNLNLHPLTEELNIAVICAGIFPSYHALLQNLSKKSALLKKIKITLVEPNKAKTDFFLKHFFKQAIPDIEVKLVIRNQKFSQFLKQQKTACYDLMYFEHPDLRTCTILYYKLTQFFLKTSPLREDIPGLANVMKPNSYLIAALLSKHELKQMQGLLKFSFKLQPKLYSLTTGDGYRGFSFGLCTPLSRPEKTAAFLQQRYRFIKFSDHLFFVCFIASIIIYGISLKHTFNLTHLVFYPLLILSQLLFYLPGYKGCLFQLSVVGLELLFLTF